MRARSQTRNKVGPSLVCIASGHLWHRGVPTEENRPQREDNGRGSSARVIDVGVVPEERNEIQNTENMVYIYDGLKRWWADRRIKEWLVAAFIVGLALGIVIGLIAGRVFALCHTSPVDRAIYSNDFVLRRPSSRCRNFAPSFLYRSAPTRRNASQIRATL